MKPQFSRAEKLVISEIMKGKSNKEAANALFIVEKTVKFHLTNIYRKAQVKSRTQLMHMLIEKGIQFEDAQKTEVQITKENLFNLPKGLDIK